jgi:cation diffusion facilitator family transporter
MVETINHIANREKKRVALSSVLMALFITFLKILVGILTNSLGILSEALHSALDLTAAGVTYFAVRVSDRPPDRTHQYGHGKIENISALFETFLLFVTVIWIIYEAISRLIEPVHVDVNTWSFVVMVASIIVDFSRSRALMKAAKKYNSQALEADALHFSTDILSSAVVILGLIVLRLAQWFETSLGVPIEWLYRADAIAALFVSGIVIYVSYKLGKKTINVLLDAADSETVKKIEELVANIEGIESIKQLRVRLSGPETFIDMTLEVPRTTTFEQSHVISDKVEEAIEEIIPRSDVLVHIEPSAKDHSSLIEKVRSIAEKGGLRVHGIRAYDIMGRLSLAMHVEIPETMTIGRAHEQVSILEGNLREAINELEDIISHIEPMGDQKAPRVSVPISSEELQDIILELIRGVPGIHNCHEIKVHSDGNETSVTFHCHVDANLTVDQAHQLTVELESEIRKMLPELGRVVIHAEPDPMDNVEDEAVPDSDL